MTERRVDDTKQPSRLGWVSTLSSTPHLVQIPHQHKMYGMMTERRVDDNQQPYHVPEARELPELPYVYVGCVLIFETNGFERTVSLLSRK